MYCIRASVEECTLSKLRDRKSASDTMTILPFSFSKTFTNVTLLLALMFPLADVLQYIRPVIFTTLAFNRSMYIGTAFDTTVGNSMSPLISDSSFGRCCIELIIINATYRYD